MPSTLHLSQQRDCFASFITLQPKYKRVSKIVREVEPGNILMTRNAKKCKKLISSELKKSRLKLFVSGFTAFTEFSVEKINVCKIHIQPSTFEL